MADTTATSTSMDQPQDEPKLAGPGEKPVGRILILVSVTVVALLAGADLYALMKVWPHPTPSGAPVVTQSGTTADHPATDSGVRAPAGTGATQQGAGLTTQQPVSKPQVVSGVSGTPGRLSCDSTITPRRYVIAAADSMSDPECVSIAGRAFPLWAEQRLLLIVILAGALGGLLHTVRSLGWYVGNRSLVLSWLPFYAFLPLTGALIAVAFYLVIRGGFFSPSGSFRDTSPFGFAAMAALVGMFSTPAALKLQQLAETMLTKPSAGADARPQPARDANAAPNAGQGAASAATTPNAATESERGELTRSSAANGQQAAG